MAEHTPGPWHYGGIENIYAYHQGPHGFLHSRVVALVPAAELEGGDEERQANARLIAAAPELLAALKAVMGEWKDGYGLNCVEQVRAAISKAEGKS